MTIHNKYQHNFVWQTRVVGEGHPFLHHASQVDNLGSGCVKQKMTFTEIADYRDNFLFLGL